MFTHAIVRKPGISMLKGISNANLGLPDYKIALEQHDAYVQALEHCGLKIDTLELDEKHPDSSFVEDTALLTPHCAIITRPGARSRRGETAAVKTRLKRFYTNIEEISSPGTIDAGDIMAVGHHYFIGLSDRTNLLGAQQMRQLLQKYGFSSQNVSFKNLLHLKTGISYIEHNNVVMNNILSSEVMFKHFNPLLVSKQEEYAANCVWINGTVLIPAGHLQITRQIKDAGYNTIELDMTEFQKLDGGLSCLSLRF